jgi:predicted dehydrogenase
LAALAAGYHVLLEKPMATTPGECWRLVAAAEGAGQQLHVCHVLRYTKHFQKMRELVASGVLGQVVNVTHHENVSWWHMAHSYVRGHWRSSGDSSPMILAKCCHDLDILIWVLDRPCEVISSVGNLLHFRPKNAPEGAPPRCLDGCPAQDTCPYYAPFIYIDLLPLWRDLAGTATRLYRLAFELQARAPGLLKALSVPIPFLRQLGDYKGWPRSVLVDGNPTREKLRQALRNGPYGRCVYHCDNDVVDHQVLLMGFAGGLSVTLTMHGHSQIEGRTTRIEGSRASLRAHFGLGGSWIEVREHRNGRRARFDTGAPPRDGHGGGDHALMAAFLESLETKGAHNLTTSRQALESHLMAFAAEQARLERRVVSMDQWRM